MSNIAVFADITPHAVTRDINADNIAANNGIGIVIVLSFCSVISLLSFC
jgi:hypothetical protein